MRLLAEDALAEFPVSPIEISTPCEPKYAGVEALSPTQICAVSVVRSGDALLEAVRDVEPGVKVGKILIQRDESRPDKPAELFYSKLPKNIDEHYILLCDPMLATGGSAIKAIECLCDAGADASKIIFANLICAPEGLKLLATAFPMIKIVTACIDHGLNDQKYIVPGLGDFGERFFAC